MPSSFAEALRLARHRGYLVADRPDEELVRAWAVEATDRRRMTVMVLREDERYVVMWHTRFRHDGNAGMIERVTRLQEDIGKQIVVQFMPPYQWAIVELDRDDAESFARELLGSAHEVDG